MTFRSIVPVAIFLALALLSLSAKTPSPQTSVAASLPQLAPRDQAPPKATGTGILRGRITRLDNGQPLRQVLISIASSDLPVLPSTYTDNDGRFELTGLPASSYTITASKSGFVTFEYGQRRLYQPGRPVALAAAAVVERLDFALPPGGAVTGRIVDEVGDPVPNVTVQVLRLRYLDGRPLLSARVVLPDTTDDRGEFRIYGIPPGTYYLSATKRGDRPDRVGTTLPAWSRPTNSTSFYPGTASPEAAQQITVAPGREVAGLSFALVSAPTATLTAVVRTADGQSVTQTPSRSRPQMQLYRVMEVGGSVGTISDSFGLLGRDGSVSWANLPPGEYAVSASVLAGVSATALTRDVAVARVTLAGVDARVELIPQKPDVARGRIIFEGDALPGWLRPSEIRVRAVSFNVLDGLVSLGALPQTNADLTFETPLKEDARLLRPTLPRAWVVKSIHMGDVDVTDTPLPSTGKDIDGITILLTDRLTEVRGVVRDANGKPVDDATVVLFADDPGRWRWPSRFVAAVRADPSGRFSHLGLPPALYVAVALDFLETGEETNPELLRRLQALGTRFELADRASTTIDVALSTVP